ncbi:hypothetical protein V498_08060 [Pseudogymnoascus sp. VKM F-4517 (FW-2822)]|nr:hypothetical protein V498_08060 [Pseudogymnoascus sp. VKM F-4517 (FW-2822)]
MQFALLATAVAIFATGAVASNCKTGLYYCGSTLYSRGNYQEQIAEALAKVQQSPRDGNDDIFLCTGGGNGAIRWVERCGSDCVDAGTDRSDHC